MTTPIFSGAQLRDEKIRLHATLTVITKSVCAMLHFSRNFNSRTLLLSGEASKIVIMSSGIGSCWSSTTFAPSVFGISEHSTRMSGMLCT